MNGPGRERRWWVASLTLIVLIYGTLYFVRGPVEFLRERGLLRLTVWAVFAISAVAAARVVWKRGFGRREGLVLLSFAVAFSLAVWLVERPEEKLHFLEYGLLGGLLFQACKERALRIGRSSFGAVVIATVLAAVASWGDEGIQALLPNRVYDPRDLLWNVLGSSGVIFALFAASAARKRELER